MKEASKESLIIFGRDVAQMPCFRNSFLYGISGGIMCGLARFMFTSRTKSATDFAVGSFVFITMSYWVYCRYNYSVIRLELNKTKHYLRQKMLTEGTEYDEEAKSVEVRDV